MTNRHANRETFLADIITTALEGGIGYWSRATAYRWYSPDLTGGTAEPATNGGGNAYASIEEHGDSETPLATWEITPDIIVKGLTKIRSHEPIKYLGNHTRATMINADRQNDASLIDADVADQIVQVSLFGEVVYG